MKWPIGSRESPRCRLLTVPSARQLKVRISFLSFFCHLNLLPIRLLRIIPDTTHVEPLPEQQPGSAVRYGRGLADASCLCHHLEQTTPRDKALTFANSRCSNLEKTGKIERPGHFESPTGFIRSPSLSAARPPEDHVLRIMDYGNLEARSDPPSCAANPTLISNQSPLATTLHHAAHAQSAPLPPQPPAQVPSTLPEISRSAFRTQLVIPVYATM